MTDKLQHLLHERAAAVDFAAPDIDALTRAGTARRHRRRAALLGGGLALAVVVAVVAVQLPGGRDGAPDAAPDVATATTAPGETLAPSWATGTVIHAGPASLDLGADWAGGRIAAYVRTPVGYLVADPDGGVWSAVAGRVERVGDTGPRTVRLVGDPSSTLVGWVDSRDDPAFVFFDQRDGTLTRYAPDTSGMGVLADEADPAYLYAVDSRVAYLRDRDGAVAHDVATGDTRVIDPAAANGFDVAAARDGEVAFVGRDGGLVVGPTRATATASIDTYGSSGAFSPDGEHLLLDADEIVVHDVATGDPVTFTLDGAPVAGFAVAYQWLDDDTVAVLGIAGTSADAPARILTCDVDTGSCEVVEPDVVRAGDLDGGGFTLPTGEAAG